MATKRKTKRRKKNLPGGALEAPRRRKSAVKGRGRARTAEPAANLKLDLDMEWLREGVGSTKPHEIEALTNRLFASVLARCGWQRNERGQIEHVGGA